LLFFEPCGVAVSIYLIVGVDNR